MMPCCSFNRFEPIDLNSGDHEGGGRGIFVGTGGDLVVEGADGKRVTLAVEGGRFYPLRTTKIIADGTTAARLILAF
jgi:hypothetical protein